MEQLPEGWKIEQNGGWLCPADEDGPIDLVLLSREDTPEWRKFLVDWEYANCDRKALRLAGEMLGYSPEWMCHELCQAITRTSRMVARAGKRLHSPHPLFDGLLVRKNFLTHKHPDFPLPDDALRLASGYMLDQEYLNGKRTVTLPNSFTNKTIIAKKLGYVNNLTTFLLLGNNGVAMIDNY